MFITLESYAFSVGVCETTAARRLKGIPFSIPDNARGRKHFFLPSAVMTLRQKEIDDGAAGRMASVSRDLGDGVYVEGATLSIAERFAEWCSGPMYTRLRAAQNAFVVAVANSRLCTPVIVENLDPLRTLFPLCSPVLVWILSGGEPPDVDRIAPAFAVASNTTELHTYEAAA